MATGIVNGRDLALRVDLPDEPAETAGLARVEEEHITLGVDDDARRRMG